jgi:hypothetical protein
VLFTKDVEITKFLDSFDAVKAEEMERIGSKQKHIMQLLEETAK